MTDTLSQKYELAAQEQEESALPIALKVAKGLVWFLYAIVVVKVVLLLTAFTLRLLGASTDAGFTQWVYRSSDRSMSPFRGIFPETEVGTASVLDMSLLFAAVMYIVLALLLDMALRWLSSKLAKQEREVQALRSAAYEASLREYEAAQQALAQRATTEQAAAVAAAVTRAAESRD